MANPVFNRLENEWEQQARTTPAGYPTMPGYEPGVGWRGEDPTRPTQAAAGARAAQGPLPTFDQHALEDAYRGAPADAVDRGRMTFDDVIVKTGLSFGLLVATAAVSWMATITAPGLGALLMGAGFLVGFVLAMVNIFSRTIRPALVLAYAGAEGLALGGLSAVFEAAYPGIVAQALVATIAVFGVTLALFTSGRVRNSPKLARFTLIGLVGILVYRLLDWVLVLTGVVDTSTSNVMVMGLVPVGVAVGLLAVLVGAACLIQDFDQAKVGVQMGAPARYAWACAFGLMVTVVWMYVEILQLLARLRSN